jgi:hypothetical protein
MSAFWLTYVPKEESPDRGWPLSDLRTLIDRVEADPDAPGSTEWWRIANSGAQIGDRVYVFKQGTQSPRGVIGVGEIVGLPQRRSTLTDPKMRLRANIRFQNLVDPTGGFLLPLAEVEDFVPRNLIDAKRSGTLVRADVAAELERRLAPVLLVGTSPINSKQADNPTYDPGSPRVPAKTLRLVEPWMIDEAIGTFIAGTDHNFQGSRDYDLLLPSGERLPPKAIFGIALSQVIGRPAMPTDFSAGWGEPCFDIIENAGYPIVRKDEIVPSPSLEADDERTWAEGSPKRIQHLRRERATGLARTKKRRFVDMHGHLFCERCGLIPSQSLGPFGDACIEVHHNTVAVAKMDGPMGTRLADLKCLCANCHRIVHREQL